MNSRTILFVCTGNTCRSPMAEGIGRKLIADGLLGEDRDWQMQSAGVWASTGQPATAEAVQAARSLGIDLSAHRSQPTTRDLMKWSGVVLTMTQEHARALTEQFPEAADRIHTLGAVDVVDPIGQSEAVYRETLAQIRTMLERKLPTIAEQSK